MTGIRSAPEVPLSAVAAGATAIARGRRRRARRGLVVIGSLAVAIAGVFLLSLMIGNTFYGPAEVVRVILGEEVTGASFTVGELRLPRALLGLVTLALKSLLEWRYADQLAASHRR